MPSKLWLATLVLAGALVAAARRIPLARCARAVDEAVQGNADRTLIALGFSDGAHEGPFVNAAMGDAVRAAGRVRLAKAAPVRRPRGIVAVAALAASTLLLALVPRQARVAQAMRPGEVSGATRTRLDEAMLEPDREAAALAAKKAAALHDGTLEQLANEYRKMLTALAAEGLEPGEALDRLAALERRARAAADEAQALARGMRAAGETMSADPQTRAAGEAMEKLDGAAAREAMEHLAARAGEMTKGERERMAKSLERAGQSAAAAGSHQPGEDGASKQEKRRLSRNEEKERNQDQQSGSEAATRENDRQLKRLERDLDESADRCRDDPEACKGALDETASDLPDMAQQAQRSAAREGLGRSMGQLRERLQRMDHGGGQGQRQGERSFERAAEGQQQGSQASQGPGGDGEMTPGQTGARPQHGGPGKTGGDGTPTASGSATAQSTAASRATSGGEGAGKDPGGDPLGARGGMGTRGEIHESHVRSGAGPIRAEVIESGAKRGFAHTDYQRVFDEYNAAVEETLDTTAVPAGRRYIVRRYFQLIRPRATP